MQGLDDGIYRYRPRAHELLGTTSGDRRAALTAAALGQAWIEQAAAVIVIAGVHERTTRKYGERGVRYVHMEVGHAAQNVYLQAVALGLGTVFVGAFDDDRVARAVDLPPDHRPLGLMPVGHAAR